MTYEDGCGGGGGLRAALVLARSPREPGPDFPAGAAVAAWPGEAVRVPAELDAVLAGALAGGRLRPAASAGALHPVNAHLLVGPGGELAPGRYAYDPGAHRLRARGGAPADAPQGVAAVLTVTARRTVSHYGHRAWPLLLLDTGHALAALALAGAEAYCGDADGALLAAAAGLPPTPGTGEPEHAVAAVWWGPGSRPVGELLTRWAAHGPGDAPVGPGKPAPDVLVAAWEVLREVTGGGGKGSWSGFPGLPVPVAAGPVVVATAGPVVVAAGPAPVSARTRPGRRAAPGSDGGPDGVGPAGVAEGGRGAAPSLRGVPDGVGPTGVAEGGRGAASSLRGVPAGIVQTVGVRRSAAPGLRGVPDGVEPAGIGQAVGVRRSAAPGFRGVPDRAELVRLVRVVEAAGPEGVRWCVAVGGPEPAVLGGPGLRPLATGDARPTLARWAARQAWLAEAGAVLLAYGCPDGAPAAEVRRAHLGAGYAVGLAQVLACEAGLPSRPVGSWQSADLGAALGAPPGSGPILHALALGRRPSRPATNPSLPPQGAPPS
ncbi:nitroreductase [Streptomyces sp. NPDC050848]|uniref:nitroreductase n=1 Tax=Streptomyces sp. NPDC050848 TaxID=3155791 RepID=UPI0033CDBCBB